ncbi:MAG: ATP-binding protein [Candidatus Uhrbacteria bacterium]|nr:ATP-binding protein [Candidatus Uhrbacteria bacterium]
MIMERDIKKHVVEALFSKKVIIVYGARQVGKTTLVKDILKEVPNSIYLSCDEPDVRAAFTDKTSTEMKAFIRGFNTIVLDEAQRVFHIGLALKLLHDTYPELTIIATGSSSFELADSAAEPLTGRNIPFTLYPISYAEYARTISAREALRMMEFRIRYGMYPAVISAEDPEQEVRQLARDYLFKDVLRIEKMRKPLVIEKLTQLLAYQIGQEISYNEIAQKLEISRQTVMSYVRMLEQAFILFRVPPLGKNKRNEITRFEKIYFFDTGIRNALIDSFGPLDYRHDSGALFENFFISERLKTDQRMQREVRPHFWRTKDGSEIDFVEESKDGLAAFECKWGGGSMRTRAWHNAFPSTPVTLVTRETIEPLII